MPTCSHCNTLILFGGRTDNTDCCCSGIKKQIWAIFFSGVLGWWGIPWGLFITPI